MILDGDKSDEILVITRITKGTHWLLILNEYIPGVGYGPPLYSTSEKPKSSYHIKMIFGWAVIIGTIIPNKMDTNFIFILNQMIFRWRKWLGEESFFWM